MITVGLLLFEGSDLLDVGGPYEVFLTASRLAERTGAPAPFSVVTATLDGRPVTAYGGLGLVPHTSLASALPLDVLVVPGAIDVSGMLGNSRLIEALAAFERAPGTLLASVCTGAFLLAEAGVLADRPWTTHWEDVDALAERLGPAGATRTVRWVDTGPVVTAGGLSSGIAMALHLVDRLAGRSLATATARQLDYVWAPDGAAPGG